MSVANCPASLKPITHYLILAHEHDQSKTFIQDLLKNQFYVH